MALTGIPVLAQIRDNKYNRKNTPYIKPHIIQLRKTNIGIVSEVKIQSMMSGE